MDHQEAAEDIQEAAEDIQAALEDQEGQAEEASGHPQEQEDLSAPMAFQEPLEEDLRDPLPRRHLSAVLLDPLMAAARGVTRRWRARWPS